ncbi:hypothetical protein [Oceanobacillus chungangensis]|uniref:DUF4367 domain-containing protein n=1 Tax=Oceanobacillus chungangensis TaxID=1229152 RepID=A0A3D8PWT6_9BACI|nr:hypothetical protein [Oceanobacillus chungangensis]RDW19748.1 hypothetical protein CWR45_06640 [Oceanobacillus chungangensis]
MKKILLTIAILLLVILVACSDDANPSAKIISEYPETIIQDIEVLPEDFRKNIVVPSKLPDTYETIHFGYSSEPYNDPTGNIINTTFIYADEATDYQLILNTMYGDVTFANETSNETVTLESGIEAKVTGEYELHWQGEDGNYQELSLLVPPDVTDADFTIDDLVEIANSMLE